MRPKGGITAVTIFGISIGCPKCQNLRKEIDAVRKRMQAGQQNNVLGLTIFINVWFKRRSLPIYIKM